MRRYELTDEEWDKLKELLPGHEGYVGKNATDNRQFLNAVLWSVRTGAPWRDLPARYGDWKNIRIDAFGAGPSEAFGIRHAKDLFDKQISHFLATWVFAIAA